MVNLKKLDNFVNKFSERMVLLKKYEEEKKNTPEQDRDHRKLYKQCISILLNRKKDFFGIDRDLWKELYLRSLFFYNQTHKINETIPLYKVTKHNEILKPYILSSSNIESHTIIHFDTHSDLNPIENSAILPDLYKKFKETNESSFLNQAQELVWDIGAAQTGILFTLGARDMVWALPNWVPDKQISVPYTLKHGKRNILLTSLESLKGIKNMDEWSYTDSSKTNNEAKIFKKIQTGKLTKNGYKSLKNLIEKNGKEYVLDIDLDYFVCNGRKFTHDYFKESYDLESYHRTRDREVNQEYPRNKNEDTNELRKYNNQLKRELRIIDLRIRSFLKIISELRKDGLVPSFISMCDSTNILFQKCDSCNSVSNGYVPTHLALYLHTKLVSGLEKLFNKKLKERKPKNKNKKQEQSK